TKIVLKAGQTSITLEGGNITFACPGTFSVKGSSHAFAGGASSPAYTPPLPGEQFLVPEVLKKDMFNEQFHLVAEDGETPLINRRYRISASHGQKWEGLSDSDGLTERIYTDAAIDLSIEVFPADTAKRVIE
ncbi:MAG: DUF2345 domain-containing protein, partial [Pyrinomonadaceae bacterium]